MAKTTCPVTRAQFKETAEPLKITIAGQDLVAEAKEFSTGSFGWFLNSKVLVPVGGKNVSVQVGLNLTIVGSKETKE